MENVERIEHFEHEQFDDALDRHADAVAPVDGAPGKQQLHIERHCVASGATPEPPKENDLLLTWPTYLLVCSVRDRPPESFCWCSADVGMPTPQLRILSKWAELVFQMYVSFLHVNERTLATSVITFPN